MTKKETTKEKILSAARMLFVMHGFAGTSIGNIAKLAGVNHSLIFHHFKNKEQLWVSVKQSIVSEANQLSSTLPECHLSFNDFLKELFLRNLRFYHDNLDISRMISWQRLEQHSNHAIGITNSFDMQRWVQAFNYYQLQGDIQSGFKPEWIVTLILSIISSAALDPNVFINEKQALDDYIEFCIETLSKALR
jgi:TetR/AcrR family transcriptional regulator